MSVKDDIIRVTKQAELAEQKLRAARAEYELRDFHAPSVTLKRNDIENLYKQARGISEGKAITVAETSQGILVINGDASIPYESNSRYTAQPKPTNAEGVILNEILKVLQRIEEKLDD